MLRTSWAIVLAAIVLPLVVGCPPQTTTSSGDKAGGKPLAKRCTFGQPCAKGEVCIRADAQGGHCVKTCQKDSECPVGWGCRGRLQDGGFCRRMIIQRGKPCGSGLRACLKNLRCFRRRCATPCEVDRDCPGVVSRCVQVIDEKVLPKAPWLLHRVCMNATAALDERCAARGPYCQRGGTCWKARCVKACHRDDQCPQKHVCNGEFIRGTRTTSPEFQSHKGPPLYCRRAGKAGTACSDKSDLTCVRGAACVKGVCRTLRRVSLGKACNPALGIQCEARCVCHRAQCYRSCQLDSDCPQIEGKQLHCRANLNGTTTPKICR